MYYVSTKSHFDAAHHLVGYKGPCRRVHGHTWNVEIFVEGTKLQPDGMLVDFREIKKKLKPILDKLDHHDLNKVVDFNPTAENLAKYIYEQLIFPPVRLGALVCEVRVWESPTSWASYSEDSRDVQECY